MPRSIVCNHLLRTPEMPCVEVLQYPTHPHDSGRTLLCTACSSQPPPLTAEQLSAVCDSHCQDMTIVETIDARDAIAP